MMHQEPQNKLEGIEFALSPELILDNKVVVTDFFGDNREWYKKLLQGGAVFQEFV